ncbi:MAG: glucans biosynthesis protein G [Candidatus Binatia bacterium]|nr:MAG: glucans biosynthesis protein G [Candidatus Binatia bacterium]
MRRFAWTAALLLGLAVAPSLGASAPLDFESVVARARERAASAFEDRTRRVPPWLLEITYDQWRDIRFRPPLSLWRDRNLPFEVQFFHPGLFYDRVVEIHEVDAEGAHRVAFSPSLFDYGKNNFASRVPQDLGFAGFRLHYPIKRPDYRDEVIVFLGASYFRAVGRDNVFGVSARGLALDTAEPRGEEFPFFEEFWLVRPSRRAEAAEIWALLESPRAAGAYRFVVYPGIETVVRVDARLFFREEVGKVGLAPLTGMFFYGENSRERPDDYRPEVHDVDGLSILTKEGEWLWRPLDNPPRLRVTSFEAADVGGFGLFQRDRDFDHYQDLETRPDLRPSVWVAPSGKWGEGRVELVEIPVKEETNDNVVAYWVPSRALEPGKEHRFRYDVSWFSDHPARPPGGRAVATRVDRGTGEDLRRIIVDFEGGALKKIPRDHVLEGVLTLGDPSRFVEQQVIPNPVSGGWRLVFQVRRPSQPLEMRAFLRKGRDALTETWSYLLEP